MSMKNSSNDTIGGNRTPDLLTCSAVPQPTAPPRSTLIVKVKIALKCRDGTEEIDVKLLSYTTSALSKG